MLLAPGPWGHKPSAASDAKGADSRALAGGSWTMRPRQPQREVPKPQSQTDPPEATSP